MKNVMIIGSGAREHALAWKLRQSKEVGSIYVLPGNGGTALLAENVALGEKYDEVDLFEIKNFAVKQAIDLAIIGNEKALTAGLTDYLEAAGIAVFGPDRASAAIEYSKAVAKDLMKSHAIKTAEYKIAHGYKEAFDFASTVTGRIVIKADGLAQGKGVYVCYGASEARRAVLELKDTHGFSRPMDKFVFEEFLEGTEVSLHALCYKTQAVMFVASQDYKRIFDGDGGPNTGGMGCVAPVPGFGQNELEKAKTEIVLPILQALDEDNSFYKGCLYPGIMVNGGQKVLEYNARFGDPETQCYMALLDCDLYNLLEAFATGRNIPSEIKWKDGYAACVVIASGGYPGIFNTGYEISGIDDAASLPGVQVFCAGVEKENARMLTGGGRVLSVVAHRKTLQEAVLAAYQAAGKINFTDMYYRNDIGDNALDI